jgi:hypothetical protein
MTQMSQILKTWLNPHIGETPVTRKRPLAAATAKHPIHLRHLRAYLYLRYLRYLRASNLTARYGYRRYSMRG